jgi:hypothetical protein
LTISLSLAAVAVVGITVAAAALAVCVQRLMRLVVVVRCPLPSWRELERTQLPLAAEARAQAETP